MHSEPVERDACGIGFVADAEGRPSPGIVQGALDALCRVRHRGAVAADALSGDGAGLLLPLEGLPFVREAAALQASPTGVAMVFHDPEDAAPGRGVVEDACAAEGIVVTSWRAVPVEGSALGPAARARAPRIEQALLTPPGDTDPAGCERAAFRARRRIERAARVGGRGPYVCSLSFRTVVYKALCAADQLAAFFPDLADGRLEAWFAIFHQRYSTNTAPSWRLAQPFRFLAHNGEINTIRGNAASMRARETSLGSHDLGPEELLRPVIDELASDSAQLDQAVELLVRGGRDLSHALAMLVPPAWEHDDELLEPAVRAFFRFHACLAEPWDGPAALVLSDGDAVVAALDRNGLRPLRVALCDDGLVACASEAGAVATRGHGPVRRLRIGPGESLRVHPAEGGVIVDGDLKRRLAARRPYGGWTAAHLHECSTGRPLEAHGRDVAARQVAAGVTKEEFTVTIRPMATGGHEPTSSMGDDTAQPPLSSHARPVFAFLKQRFAQVTNPPIDHMRERHVMSISTRLGGRAPLLEEGPASARLREYPSFLLFPSALEELARAGATTLDASFDVALGPEGLERTCVELGRRAAEAVGAGAGILVVSQHAVGPERAPVPSALAAGAVHHRLLEAGLRSRASIVVDADDVTESHHAACLLTNGTDALCPRLALESVVELATRGRLGGGADAGTAQVNLARAIEEGVMKIMSKMGISTLDSYRGAQIVEAVGLGPDVVELCFTGMSSPLGGLSLLELGAHVLVRHDAAFSNKPMLANPGFVKFKRGGEYHALNPDVVEALQDASGTPRDRDKAAAHELRRAVRGDATAYERFAALVDGRPATEPRDLLEVVPAAVPVPLDEVEGVESIARRFSTGAMSHGALSAEAHETLSAALNSIGGKANTGEGGEAPERYRDERNSSIKQIASGRFGVTPEYVAFAEELQIKMAQGSKPGEGGQLPGKKVTQEIARLRHTVPGVALISPPPHHDIYSIEDLAQLIFDLKQANPRAAISVKLVSSEGVGTVAAGVVKGLADVVHVAGADGGTGASPLSSIKNAGMPWEVGLADVQGALVANGLRARVRVRVDGGLKTGRDVVVAALLGADEFSFGTAALVAEGCILVRTCHRDTCPVGIATQDPELRARFSGTPEMVARYLLDVAEDVRRHLACIGLRSLDEAVGRTDLLRPRGAPAAGRAMDVGALLADPVGGERRHVARPAPVPRSDLGDRLYDDAIAAAGAGSPADLSYPISTADRSVGARLGCAVGYELGARKMPVPVRARFEGSAGQSFGAFLSDGIDLVLTGEANDYVCKGMGGGRVVIRAPADDLGDPCLVGNTALYGATGGRLFVAGRAGERFAVRNSGAVAVAEGAGDHACEYMTAGAVVVLGPTGRNVGAGMSGGEAYFYDPDDELEARVNPQLVGIYEPTPGQLESLRRVVARHADATGSARAWRILNSWDVAAVAFKRVAPRAEVSRLEALFEGTEVAAA